MTAIARQLSFTCGQSTHQMLVCNDYHCPLFRATDVGDCLGIKQIRSSTKDFDSDEKVRLNYITSGGPQQCTFLTEAGILKLVMRSNKPNVKPFQKWIGQMMPMLRREIQMQLEGLRDQLHYEAQRESYVRDTVASQVQGQKEYETPCGRADVVSDDAVIEIKIWKHWKHALGQVLAYGTFMPNKSKEIRLFAAEGDTASAVEAAVAMAQQVCGNFGVTVVFQGTLSITGNYTTLISM
jgi:prophage antirepressor-like protein